jgi:DNA-binding MarR family transcriptional regulator
VTAKPTIAVKPSTDGFDPPQPVEAGSPRGCTHFKLRQLDRAVGRHYDAHMAAVGLKNTQYSMLSLIVLFGPIRPMDLAARLRMEPSTLTRNLRLLMDQGWVVQGPGPDARSRLIAATDDGREKRAQAQAAWKQAQLAINERLSPGRVAALHALIDDALGLLDKPERNTGAD